MPPSAPPAVQPYRVLARKYRPRGFDAMVGQEHVVQALANAVAQAEQGVATLRRVMAELG